MLVFASAYFTRPSQLHSLRLLSWSISLKHSRNPVAAHPPDATPYRLSILSAGRCLELFRLSPRFQSAQRTPRIHAGSVIPIKAAKPRRKGFQENANMQISHRVRVVVIALAAMVGACISSATYAGSGIVRISVVKGGWFIGANGGWGMLIFHGRRYPLSVGGVDAGLVFGLSQTTLVGRVINIRRPSDVAGVYVAGGAGAAVGVGVRLIQIANEKGAVLQLEGRQIGLMANLDLSGLAIALR
jgi:hypothetical protein